MTSISKTYIFDLNVSIVCHIQIFGSNYSQNKEKYHRIFSSFFFFLETDEKEEFQHGMETV